MIVKSPVDLLPFIENDLEIKRINVGNMSNRNNTTVLRPNISVTDEERSAFEKLLSLDIEITTIMTPDDKRLFKRYIVKEIIMTNEVILMSHGLMAKEILNSAQMILGDQINYPVVSMTPDDGIEGTFNKLDKIIGTLNDAKEL